MAVRLGKVVGWIAVPRDPIATYPVRIGQRLAVTGGPELGCGLLVFQDLHAQTAGDVEGDMAVDKPCARVVGLEGDYDVSVIGQEYHVSSWRIVEEEVRGVGIVNLVSGLFKDRKVMTV